MCACVSVMYASFLTIILIWTSSLPIKDLFNPAKSKLLCFNASNAVTSPIKWNSQPEFVVDKENPLVAISLTLYHWGIEG